MAVGALLAMAIGLLLGPEALGALRVDVLHDEHKIVEELARITLSLSLVSTGPQS